MEIKGKVHYVGVNDRNKALFENLWPLPYGCLLYTSSARRFLKKVDRGIDIDALTFYPLNKHTPPEDISGYLKPLLAGQSMGVISEAVCPAVADPGADVVAIAQRKNLKVVPLVGPDVYKRQP